VRDKGVVLAEPRLCDPDHRRYRSRPVGWQRCQADDGQDAGKHQSIRPLRNGVISDLEVAEQMIKHFIRKAQGERSSCAADRIS